MLAHWLMEITREQWVWLVGKDPEDSAIIQWRRASESIHSDSGRDGTLSSPKMSGQVKGWDIWSQDIIKSF